MIYTNDKLQYSFETPYLFLIAYAVPENLRTEREQCLKF